MKILLTGYTGNLGPEIAMRLAPHEVHAIARDPSSAPEMPHVTVHRGTLATLPESLAEGTEIVVHAAANTAFLAPPEELHAANVAGTGRVLEFAAKCPALRKVVHVSTACVCGTRTGVIPEARLPEPPAFVNAYEKSKWEAEEQVLDSGLPVEIVRLSIVAGSERDGMVRRPGALHHALYWIWKGLIPMMPGSPETPVDLISTEHAAEAVATRALAPLAQHRIVHGCAGDQAPLLGELLDHLHRIFSSRSAAWKSGSILPPMIVDASTFALFERTVEQSGDLLFRRVCRDSQAFLPGLLHPRRHAVSTHRAAEGPGWRQLAELVTRHVTDARS